MRVDGLRLRGFTNHAHTEVEFPAEGVVVVTGRNGSGKSSLLEAVAWATWGKTVRGASPVPEGAKLCTVEVLGPLYIARERKGVKGRASLTWGDSAEPARTLYETATKAQEALDGVVGDFDRWRRTHVFTSVDAWGFADAPDAHRKVLLEQLLGLECFDTALQRCRVDLRGARLLHTEAASRAAAADARVATLEGLLLGVEHVAPLVDDAALRRLEARLQNVLNAAESCGREHAEALARCREVRAEGDRLAGEETASKRVKASLDALRGAPACPTCSQELPPELVPRLETRAQEERAALGARWDDIRARAADAEEQANVLRAELREFEDGVARLRWELREANASIQAREQGAQRVAAARAQHATAQEEAVKRRAEEREAAERLAVLEEAELALGLRGVRATVLDGALATLEELSNLWLARLGLVGLRVRLQVVEEKVSLAVDGAGGGQGYAAASAGERRRIALALMLALAELAQSTTSVPVGTLWFDEVFDVLDEDGVAAVWSLLTELSVGRCVVVITHSHQVLQHAPPSARRLHVEAGIARWDNGPSGAKGIAR